MGYNPARRSFPTSKLAAVVERLAEEGVSAERALMGVGLAKEALADPQTRISVQQLLVAYENALALSERPDFALQLGRGVRVTFYGIYGFAMLSCPTHRAVIDFAVRYHGLSCATSALGFRATAPDGAGSWTIKPISEAARASRLWRFVVEVNAATIRLPATAGPLLVLASRVHRL
jgi:hypothetical protein